MDSGTLFLAGVGALLCVGGGVLWVNRWARMRHLLDTPPSRIRSAAQGYVELTGVLREHESATALLSPLTGSPCLWWRYRIEQYKSSGKSGSWRVVEQGSSDYPLRLADATGECLIDPRGAEVLPAWRKRWYGDQRHPRRLAPSGLLGWMSLGGRYRYTEERLHAGEPLYAIGEFRTSGGGRQGFDRKALKGQILREWKEDYAGLLQRFDSNRDGQLDMAEWQRVRLAALLEAEDRHRQASASPELHRLTRPARGLPFVLSSHGEEVLARRYRWQAIGGAILCMAGALLLTSQLR